MLAPKEEEQIGFPLAEPQSQSLLSPAITAITTGEGKVRIIMKKKSPATHDNNNNAAKSAPNKPKRLRIKITDNTTRIEESLLTRDLPL